MTRTLARTLSIALVLSSAAALAEPQILLFPALGTPKELVVMGRVLKEAPSQGSSTLSKNLRRLAASDWDGAPVEVRWGEVVVKTKAGKDGVFEATLVRPEGAAAKPGFDRVEARAPGAAATASVRILDPEAPFFVISDFDDTLAITNVIRKRGLLRAALLQDADTQPVVKGMSAFYQCLIEDQSPMPGLAVVSGSPHQYSGRIAKFLGQKGFPFAALYLRDFGLDTMKDYKQPIIRKLIARLDEKVILVGDSGEHDPEIYAQIRKEFPDKVLQIYIRDAGRTEDQGRFKDMVLFSDARKAAEHAAQQGFITPACLETKFGAERTQR